MDKNKMKKFFDDYLWLYHHPIFKDKDHDVDHFHDCITFDVVRVDPETWLISDIPEQNTEIRIWIEGGPYIPGSEMGDNADLFPNGTSSHDYNLDTSGATVEEAYINFAAKVRSHYGDY